MQKTVNIIQPRFKFDNLEIITGTLKKRVCAYCRVSTDNIEQKTSYDAQVDEYTKRINNNPDWEFVKVYADEGISGTSTKKRVAFNEMIDTARRGEVDLILTKSISRFARNTVDCLSYIRELRLIKVEIYFEKENIYSSDPKVDFLLTIMSSIAQEEARNISENVKWSIQKKFKEGVPQVNHKRFLGYTIDEKKKQLVIVPEEAEVVRLVFKMYTDGRSMKEIVDKMMSLGYKTGASKVKWNESTVRCILRNEKYVGDLLQQKTVTLDYLTHKRVKNKEIAPKFYIEDNHEPIIDREIFDLAQKIRKDRAAAKRGENKNTSKYNARYPFSSLLICNCCGRSLKRRYWNVNSPAQRVMQQCGSYLEGKGNCKAKAVYNDVLEGATLQLINELFIGKTDIMKVIKDAIKKVIALPEVEKMIIKINNEIEEKETLINNLIDMKMKTPSFDDSIFNNKYGELKFQIEGLYEQLRKLEIEHVNKFNTTNRIEKIDNFLDIQDNKVEEITADLLKAFIHKVLVVERDKVIFCVASTKSYSDNEFNEKRNEFINYPIIHEGNYTHPLLNKYMNYRVILI